MNYVDNPFKSPAVLSFCPGILGIERGLARAGCHCRVAAYIEIEAFIIKNLVAGMEAGVLGPSVIWTNAETFDARPFRGRITGITGGYPCPGESLAGLREGHLYKGFIWPSIRRAIAATRPLFCFFENVDDHLTGTYPIVQRSLRTMGYAVEAGIFTAEEVGAPHERQRLFILALADSAKQGLQKSEWAKPGQYNKAGEVLANPNIISRRLPEWKSKQEGDSTRQIPNIVGVSKTMADTEGLGMEGLGSKREQIANISNGAAVFGCNSERIQRWPAGQGYFQYDWEEPRETKSGLGITINGYNFREDLLRAIGNSVVEQTAELAFLNLLEKHLRNFK